MNRSELRALWTKALASDADAMFASRNFSRSPKGMVFTRKLPHSIQALAVSPSTHPSYRPGALAHIYPLVRLSMPDVCKRARELVGENLLLLANAPEVMVNKPLDHLVPLPERVQWYAFQQEDLRRIAREIGETFLKWGSPFFDDHRNAEDLVRGFEAEDGRPKLQENWSIFIAAAYLVVGQKERAWEVVDSAFRTPGARAKYSVVFNHLQKLLNSSPRNSETD